jgi:vacuolar-type H+-ATPase subunit I/STV1
MEIYLILKKQLVLGRLLNYFYFNGDKIKSKNFFLIVIIVIIVIIVLHFFTIHINVLFYMFCIL